MASKDRLIGADGSLLKASFGSEITSGSSVAGSWYKIEKRTTGTTVFPAEYGVGDLFLGPGTPVTFTASESAKLATFTALGDVTSFSLEYSADEVEVTVLKDSVKKYRRGKSDMSGTIEGINLVSEMIKSGSFVNRFMRVVTATAANVATLNVLNSADLYCQFMLQKDTTTAGETHAFVFAQIDLYGTTLGAAIGDAQSWSSGVRIIGNDPILYFKANS